MSWIHKLYETYENCQSMIGMVSSGREVPLLPICHTTNKAQIEIVIDHQGNFKRARIVPKRRCKNDYSMHGEFRRSNERRVPASYVR